MPESGTTCLAGQPAGGFELAVTRASWRLRALWVSALLFALVALGGAGATPFGAHAAIESCVGNPDSILSTQSVLGLNGAYALPATNPVGLVVFGHGYRNSSVAWYGHLAQAAHHGLVAVAVDYRGLGPAPDYRGWPASAGAADLVTAGQFFQNQCGIKQVVLLGVSMGGNMTGLAVAAKAKRLSSSTPLWDYWIDVEGVTNWIETYASAVAVGKTGNAYAAGAGQDIAAEAGGTLIAVPKAYAQRDVLLRVPDIAKSGIKGVVMIHSVEDGTVPSDQTRETAVALRLEHVKTDVYSILRRTADRDPGHDQSTLLGAAGLGADDPFSGHAWEGSSTHIVMTTSMSRLFALFEACSKPTKREFIVDSGLGIVPSPDSNPSCGI